MIEIHFQIEPTDKSKSMILADSQSAYKNAYSNGTSFENKKPETNSNRRKRSLNLNISMQKSIISSSDLSQIYFLSRKGSMKAIDINN